MTAIERRVRTLLDMEPADRLRAIIDDDNAVELVEAFPPQELLVTIKRVGESDALPLIELASSSQLLFFCDVEWWIGDTLDAERILHWLELLGACGDEKIIQWLSAVDPDFFVTVLHKFMRVTKPDEGTDPATIPGALPPYTIDGIYHFNFFGEDAHRILGRILFFFYHVKPDLFGRMMEGVVWEAGNETEELAIRWRDGRLRDLGIPDYEEAVAVYRYLDENRFRQLPLKEGPLKLRENEVPVHYPLVVAGSEGDLLIEAVGKITDPETIDGISQELAHLVNRVIVADQEDLADVDAMMRAAGKVRAVLSMGLEVLTGKDANKAAEVLTERWLLYVFQVGYSQALNLTRRIHKISASGLFKTVPECVDLLDEPLKRIVEGLKKPRPLWYVGGAEPYRFFNSIEEIKKAQKALDVVEYLFSLFFEKLKLIEPDPESWTRKKVYRVDITFSVILRTAFANAAAGRGFEYKALGKSDIVALMDNAFENAPPGEDRKRRIKKDVKTDLVAYIENLDPSAGEKEKEIRDIFVSDCIDFLDEELGRLDLEGNFSPRFIQGLLIKK